VLERQPPKLDVAGSGVERPAGSFRFTGANSNQNASLPPRRFFLFRIDTFIAFGYPVRTRGSPPWKHQAVDVQVCVV
jgi:hypothetical protein